MPEGICLEANAQETREELAWLTGLRKEYGGQKQTAITNSPQYTGQDEFHLYELHGDPSVKFIILILLTLLLVVGRNAHVAKMEQIDQHQRSRQLGALFILR